jgi:hypothetical protein
MSRPPSSSGPVTWKSFDPLIIISGSRKGVKKVGGLDNRALPNIFSVPFTAQTETDTIRSIHNEYPAGLATSVA